MNAETRTQIMCNHVGFFPNGAKTFVVVNPVSPDFTVVNRWDERVVLKGKLKPCYGGDLAEAWVGDFSEVKAVGTYLIHAGRSLSRVVNVHSSPYEIAVKTIYNYYPTQRCGNSGVGWSNPCHMNDADNILTGEHVDVTGGWHQSCDLRKWLFGTSHGLHALTAMGESSHLSQWEEGRIADELRWGNVYFHKMIRPTGGLMDFVSVPNGWGKDAPRKLMPTDASFLIYFNQICGQAKTAMYFKSSDPAYAEKCLTIAKELWDYAQSPKMPDRYDIKPFKYHEYLPFIARKCYRGSSLYHGDRIYAAIYLYKATGDTTYLDEAARSADSYVALQVGGDVLADPVAGSFWMDGKKTEFDTISGDGTFGPRALCELVELLPRHPNSKRWMQAISDHAIQCIVMSRKNPWGLIPFFWYTENMLSCCRPLGKHWYKYFDNQGGMPTQDTIGHNLEILGKALFLIKAGDLLGRQAECRSVAQRQVDWVLGCNPFDASMVEGVGYNQHERLINNDEFVPPVPQIPGAVQTGISCVVGTDSPVLGAPEGGVSVEYDMPATSLMAMVLMELLACCA